MSDQIRIFLAILGASLIISAAAWVNRKKLPQWLYRTKDDPPLFRKPGAPLETSQSVGKSLQEYSDFYLSKNTILGSHSEDFQRKLKEQMYGSVAEVFAADNPFIKCREKLAEYVASFADWAVLCLKPDEKAQLAKDDVRLSPFISGELYHHIRQCAQNNGELAQLIARDENCPDDALIDWANARSCAYQYLMNCMNVVRADVSDYDPAWFRPFVNLCSYGWRMVIEARSVCQRYCPIET